MTTTQRPKAKTERLIVREIDGETLVYDRSRDGASCLNEFAAKVWRECDGETSVAEIAAGLGEDERAVWLALHQLTKAQLLTGAIAFPPDMSAAKSRREIGARLGLGAAAFVTSIVTPLPAQAASGCGHFLQPCSGGPGTGTCCAGLGLVCVPTGFGHRCVF
jgi:Coenzyme PQQ synthesis protein D (PqqD)